MPTFTAKWKTLAVSLPSLHSCLVAIKEPRAFLARHSGDGQLLAVALNQRDSFSNKMAFIAPVSEVWTIMDMKGMGTRFPMARNSGQVFI